MSNETRICVKTYRLVFADGGTDAQRERAWHEAARAWWREAEVIARNMGVSDIYQDGRSGGWLVAPDVEPGTETAVELKDRITKHLADAPRYFADSLHRIIKEDADHNLEQRRQAATLRAALRLWQGTAVVPHKYHAIATDGDQIDPLTDDEIELLYDTLRESMV